MVIRGGGYKCLLGIILLRLRVCLGQSYGPVLGWSAMFGLGLRKYYIYKDRDYS
jgi:hypothetical protein